MTNPTITSPEATPDIDVSRLLAILVITAAMMIAAASAVLAQDDILITQNIDESSLVTLEGNTRPEANARNDRGPVADDFPMEHLLLQLRRPAGREESLEQYINELSDPKSPNYHHWLTAQELGQKYGLAQEDLATITAWLQSHGFTVNGIDPNDILIDFSGTAGQVREAFHTEIHQLEVNGKQHIANMSDPRIPAALAPAIVGVVSLNNFMPHPTYRQRAQYTAGQGYYLLVPADLATIYNLNPLFKAGYSGQGQRIVVLEDSDVYSTADWTKFRTTFGLTRAYPSGSFTQVHPAPGKGGTCTDPGANGDDFEATIDAEWASAAAPNAAIELASCADTTNFGGFIALQNLLSNGGTPPAIVSIGYAESETLWGAAGNSYIKSLYQQAASEGVSVFVAAGDWGAAVSDISIPDNPAAHGINVSAFASTPYNVAVGGTDFSDTYSRTNSTYWSSTNGSTDGSALSYIPEIPWNDSCASVLIAKFLGYSTTYGSSGFCNTGEGEQDFLNFIAGSGGPSGCATGAPSNFGVVSGTCAGYAKPAWQSVFGNPKDGVRDLPDVSLFASDGMIWGHYYVLCIGSALGDCSGAPGTWLGGGGTSFAAPIMAGIQALANQKSASRQGNPNPTYYSLASTEYGASGSSICNSSHGKAVSSSCIFHDVTQGDEDVVCIGSNNCYTPSGTFGVLSTSKSAYKPAYGTTIGWDFATGIGSVNAYNLVMAFGAAPK